MARSGSTGCRVIYQGAKRIGAPHHAQVGFGADSAAVYAEQLGGFLSDADPTVATQGRRGGAILCN